MLHPPQPTSTEGYIAEIYNAIASIRDEIADINTKFQTIDGRCLAENIRVSGLERWRWTVMGATSVAVFILGMIGGMLVNILFNAVGGTP